MSASAGWFPDPTGRFGQRWYDGHRWSDQVVAADGSAIQDALPERDTPYPPPAATPPKPAPTPAPAPARVAAPAFAAPGRAPVGFGTPKVRLLPGATLGIGLLGLVLIALSLFVLSWSEVGDFSFLDLSEAARDASGGELIPRAYAGFAGFILFFGAILGVLLAGIPLPNTPTGATIWRIIASLGSGLAAILHTLTVARLFRGAADPEVAAWLGTVGYFVIILAMVIGHHTRRRTTAGLAP